MRFPLKLATNNSDRAGHKAPSENIPSQNKSLTAMSLPDKGRNRHSYAQSPPIEPSPGSNFGRAALPRGRILLSVPPCDKRTTSPSPRPSPLGGERESRMTGWPIQASSCASLLRRHTTGPGRCHRCGRRDRDAATRIPRLQTVRASPSPLRGERAGVRGAVVRWIRGPTKLRCAFAALLQSKWLAKYVENGLITAVPKESSGPKSLL